MRFMYLYQLALMVCFVASLPAEDGILVLTDDNFDVAINTYKFVFVDFYAIWCQPCQQFMPEYVQLAEKLRDERVPVHIAKLDGSVHKLQNQRFEIQSFPTFKLFVNGYPLDYDGVRGMAAMLEFIKETIGETLDELPTVDDVDEYLNETPVALIFFLESAYDRQLNIFNIGSKVYTDVAFGFTISGEARERYKAKKNQVILFKTFDEERNEYRGKLTVKGLLKFIDENAYPMFSEFDERAEERIFKRGKSALILFWGENEASIKQQKILQNLAPLIKKRVQVVAVNPKDGFLTSILERLETQSVKYPDLFYYKTNQGQKGVTYRFKEEFTIDNILRFMDYAAVGKIERNYRSQEVPMYQTGPIMLIVGDTFEQLVEKSGKDVFIEFMAAWCKDCKKFHPELFRLAYSLSNNPNIMIAQLDGDQNDISEQRMQKFPTFRLYRAKLPSVPLEFTQEFSYDRALAFIRNHTSFNWIEPLRMPNPDDNTENTDL